jgi:hypothetical protein
VRLALSVARLCKLMSLRHAAEFYRLAWDDGQAHRQAPSRARARAGPIDLEGVRVIAMDEFAIHKGHRYATVIVEPYRKRVLWLGLGRGRHDVRPFFELLGPAGRASLQAVAMDMNAGYAEEVRAQCPGARIVYRPVSRHRQVRPPGDRPGSRRRGEIGDAKTNQRASWSKARNGCWRAIPRTSPGPKTRSVYAICSARTGRCSPST